MVGGYNSYGAFRNISWYAGASVAYLVDSILNDQNDCLFCFVEEESMSKMIFVLVFLIIGKNGVEEIIEIELNDKKKQRLLKVQSSSAQ
jgi:malate dehydrogenase